MADRWYYICDHCGSIVNITVNITDAPIPEDENWECADCGSSAMWEFTNEGNAMQHAEHIRRLVASGLVRRS